MVRYIELGHEISDGMRVYPGLPSPTVRPHLSHTGSREHYGGAAEFEITGLELVGNVGTYLDAPYHRFPEREDIARVPLERLVDLDVVVITVPEAPGPIDVDVRDVGGKAVLFASGWSRRWGTDAYWVPGPHLGATTTRGLTAGGAALVGVDFWNVDDTGDPARPVHTQLLAAGIPIVEHLCNLDEVPADGARLWVLPLRVQRAASVPVRPVVVVSAA